MVTTGGGETTDLNVMIETAKKFIQSMPGGPMGGMGPIMATMPPPMFQYSFTVDTTAKGDSLPKVHVQHIDAAEGVKLCADLYETLVSLLRKKGFKAAHMDMVKE